jgi:predicted nucleotidyltransferase component of viral defense system
MGLDAASVEKDFWVCWTLREIFALPGIGGHITFKGGTSLSKAWKLIQRFSEDIDLIVDKEVLGFGGDAAPDNAPSNKQRKARLEALMRSCRDWVQGTIQPYVTEHFPTLDPSPSFPVRVLAAERTFWEKACLLHEETFRPPGKVRKSRMARHYYDLCCLLSAGIGKKALAQTALFQRVAEHRELFFRYSWVDYTTHKPGSFRLTLAAEFEKTFNATAQA